MVTSPQLKVTVHRQQHVAQCFYEPLGEYVRLKMMVIPAGRFRMGSPENEEGRTDAEGPVHEVSVPRFFLGKYPVTQTQWRAVVSMPAVNRELNSEPSGFKGDMRPVERVSWEDAVEFCDRLAQDTGHPYRLPSEAEWEYACRAGTTTPFHFGETITTDVANYRGTDNEEYGWSGSYGGGPHGEYRKQTSIVDQFPCANPFGLVDMHGNVWEWCQDHWHDNYNGAPGDGSAWVNENDNRSRRVNRGGSWFNIPEFCRSARRVRSNPPYSYYSLGFRVACSAPRS